MLPEEWLRKLAPLADLGTAGRDHVRFHRNQAGLLDALLASQPEVRFDEAFSRVREQLRRFEGVASAEQPAGFAGQLRDYQRDGLGWMHFLRQFGFGGCLADDMGVGKTAQVPGLLETRRELRETAQDSPTPSLVVVPKSLVFNWKQEAARFTPRLRILDHTGLGRKANGFEGCDVVLTTYGTLRRDAVLLKDAEFDYIVLDEAQAIKNAGAESAKAVRLLACALRPFILRRTKQQVARELPEKTEQTLWCELEPNVTYFAVQSDRAWGRPAVFAGQNKRNGLCFDG